MLKKYTKEDAKQFSEGNKILEEILLQCWEKGIQTKFCCAGHYFKDFKVLEKHCKNKCNWNNKTEAEYFKKHSAILNHSAYLYFDCNEDDYNFLAHFLNKNNIDQSYFIIIEYTNGKKGWGIYADTVLERDEKVFNEKTDIMFSKLCESIKTYDCNIKYYSPYVALFEKLKENLSDTIVSLNKCGITIQTKEAIYVPSFKCSDRKEIGCSYFAKNDISIINQALEEIQVKNFENDLN